jgi:hypothetical protein
MQRSVGEAPAQAGCSGWMTSWSFPLSTLPTRDTELGMRAKGGSVGGTVESQGQ